MTVYETTLTQGNIDNGHIYVTPFRDRLPSDVFGRSSKEEPASRSIRLEFGSLVCGTDIPEGRNFFRDRSFSAELFKQARAAAGDTIILEEVTPYHYRIAVRWPCGTIVSRR